MFKTIEWANNKVRLIDQTKLPHKLVIVEGDNYFKVAKAIKEMKIRGAPAIGVAAALGIALGAVQSLARSKEEFLKEFSKICSTFRKTRPTAVNLFWAIERMERVVQEDELLEIRKIKKNLLQEAKKILKEDIETNKRIGKLGANLIDDGDVILTHCNTGALATAGLGTALGIIKTAAREGKKIRVFVDETRPYLQGARLTCWELLQEKIPTTLICDNMAGYFIHQGIIKKVFVGADRIAKNGDVANKIGTYPLAVLCRENKIPFYVAAPTSTIDLSLSSGKKIPIEERDSQEVTKIMGKCIAPLEVEVRNPAFDITPAKYITAIITEKGIR